MKEDMYITLVSMNHFFGIKPFKKDGILKLIKEKYDKDDFFNFEQDIRIERKLFYDFLVE